MSTLLSPAALLKAGTLVFLSLSALPTSTLSVIVEPQVSPRPIRKQAPPQAIDWSVPKRYQGKIVLNRPKGFSKKVVALTFDDGPSPQNTPRILKTLEKNDIKATFFLLGCHLSANGKIIKQMVQEGHVIGNHSYSHPAKPSKEQALKELDRTARGIKKITGKNPTVFRPPYGITDNWLTKRARHKALPVINWNVESADVFLKSGSKVYTRVTKNVFPGAIVLMHDGHKQHYSADALPAIIKTLKKKGYEFVTVPEMLRLYDAHAAERERKAKASSQ